MGRELPPLSTQTRAGLRDIVKEISGLNDNLIIDRKMKFLFMSAITIIFYQMFWVIKNGSPGTGMLAHKKSLVEDEIWEVAGYIRSTWVE